MLTNTYRLSMEPGVPDLNVYISQYDVGKTLVFTLVNTATSASISSGVNVEIRGTKPDGHGFSYNQSSVVSYSYSNSTAKVTVQVQEQMTAVAGKVVCEIILYKGTPATTDTPASSGYQQLGTANFYLNVERAALDKDTLRSDSSIRQLVNIIDHSDDIIAAANTSNEAKNRIIELEASATEAASEARASQQAAAASEQETKQLHDEALQTINSQKAMAIQAIEDAADDNMSELQDDFDEKIAEIQAEKTIAEEKADLAIQRANLANSTSSQALDKATNAENETAEFSSTMDGLRRKIEEMELKLTNKFDDAYLENGFQYFTADGAVVCGPLGPFAGGGGGGGGDSGNNAIITLTNTSGWMSKTISKGSPCVATFTWSSTENDIPTGDGTLTVLMSGAVKAMINISQGNGSIDLSKYTSTGANVIKLNVSDVYGNSRTINFSINVVELSITSSFNASTPYSGPISFPYIPVGSISKNVYFILDGETIGTVITSVSGRQQSFTIPEQSHGAHTFRCYFDAEINGEIVESNELYYEILCVEPFNETPIITSSFKTTEVAQYTPLYIDYTVYNPASLTADIEIRVNGSVVSRQTVDRTTHTYDYRPDNVGTDTIAIVCGSVTKSFTIEVSESEIDVNAETEDLSLYLSSAGRSNSESIQDRSAWSFNDVHAIMTGFNWVSNGWIPDSTNAVACRVSGSARVEIPAKIFAQDFRNTGKTIEIDFSTDTVMDYDASIISCMSGGRGLAVTPQLITLTSEQSTLSAQFKENEHVRISFVIEKQSENRLIYCYINGIMSGAVRYPSDDDFSQSTPVNISIGSDDAAVNLYCIRVYDNDLNRTQILDNWIADSTTIDDMLRRYSHNNVYDQYGNIVISNLPNDLPYIVIQANELPQYKGDKKTVSGYFTNPLDSSKSFTFEGAQIDVQGTSSQYYARKNYKIKYKNGVTLANGTKVSKYQFIDGDLPINVFCFKADVASSEGANNVELARLYNMSCPYKIPAQVEDSRIKQGIDGFPMVLFWDNGTDIVFMGKYNFNADKSAEEFFGFQDEDESWEIKNNTSNRVIWKSADYESMGVDEDGKPIPDWLNDFEARYPDTDPAYTNPAQLKEFAEWIVKTDRTAATGDELDEEVTYLTGEVDINGDPISETFTEDTSRYRLLKFRNEIGNYVELDSAFFYYLFTELFLMVDSRAKNAFPSFMGEAVIGGENP